MSNGNGEARISVKQLATIVGFVVTLATSVGFVVAAYYKGMSALDARIQEIERVRASEKLDEQKRYLLLLNRYELLERNVETQSAWQERSLEVLADELPELIRDHEWSMHSSKGKHSDVTQRAGIALPKKPEPLSVVPIRDPSELMLEQKTLSPPKAAE